MVPSTPATAALARAAVPFSVHGYAYDPDAAQIGMQAAEALGEPPSRVLKTLMATVDGRPFCAIIPSDMEMSMKRLAVAFAGKGAQMMRAPDAERLSGYVIGGISPFGQKRRVPTAIEEQAMRHDLVYINAGRRGLQVRLSPVDAARALDAVTAPLVV